MFIKTNSRDENIVDSLGSFFYITPDSNPYIRFFNLKTRYIISLNVSYIIYSSFYERASISAFTQIYTHTHTGVHCTLRQNNMYIYYATIANTCAV